MQIKNARVAEMRRSEWETMRCKISWTRWRWTCCRQGQSEGVWHSLDYFLLDIKTEMDFQKFKAAMGDEYELKVKQIAKSKDVKAVNKVCSVCEQLEFDHKPGPCTRSNKAEKAKYSAAQIAEIKEHVMSDVVQAIIEETKANLEKT